MIAYGEDITNKVLMTEAVIVGQIPDAYYNLDSNIRPIINTDLNNTN